jgi:hypothetical protein
VAEGEGTAEIVSYHRHLEVWVDCRFLRQNLSFPKQWPYNAAMDSYPYIISNNKIEPILTKIRSAARPQRVTIELLKKWGFSASNDRAMLRVLKVLGFLDENGAPTPDYDRLRDPTDWKYVLGERVKDTYADLYAIDEKIDAAPDDEVRGAISRVTGKDQESVNRYFTTFRTLAGLAKFDGQAPSKPRIPVKGTNSDPEEPMSPVLKKGQPPLAATDTKASLHYNIQIHLPATSDISVYNVIFKSLRENLIT